MYGNDHDDIDNDYAVPLDELADNPSKESFADAPRQDDKKNAPAPPATGFSSLPPKPTTDGSLSYSAQIAKQFSSYQQTPSQERRQRDDAGFTGQTSGNTPATGTHEDRTNRPVRPSEMKDEG